MAPTPLHGPHFRPRVGLRRPLALMLPWQPFSLHLDPCHSGFLYFSQKIKWLKSTLLITTFSQGPGMVFREWGWNGKEKGSRVWLQPPFKWSQHQTYTLYSSQAWSQVMWLLSHAHWHTLILTHQKSQGPTTEGGQWRLLSIVWSILSIASFFSQPPVGISKSLFPFFFSSFFLCNLPMLSGFSFYYAFLWSLHVLT